MPGTSPPPVACATGTPLLCHCCCERLCCCEPCVQPSISLQARYRSVVLSSQRQCERVASSNPCRWTAGAPALLRAAQGCTRSHPLMLTTPHAWLLGRAGRSWGALGVGADAPGGEPAGIFWAELGRTGQGRAGRTWGALRGGAEASGGEPDGGAGCSLEPPCCCPAEEASIKASNCAVLIRMISILAFWTGRSLPASSVVSRPVVISAFSNKSVMNCRLHTVAPAADVRLHALDAGYHTSWAG